ncbi:MAG TPA: hypothetical protein VHP31_11960 [Caproicibacter sp.]|nr:hypothetical protein [Caproicibacter sp.]
MADENTLGSKVGLDVTDFKAGVSQLTASIRSIEAGFRASAAVMGNWSSNTNGLRERTSSLNEKLDLQKQKLNILHEEYDKVVKSSGATSSAAESLANKMFSAEKAIASTEKDLGKYSEQLKKVNEESKKFNLSGLKDGLSKIGGGLSAGIKATGAAVVGVGAAAAGAAAGVYKMASEAGENASQLKVLSEQTGMSTDQLQTYQYTADKLGISLDTITGVQSKLVKNMAAAQNGTKAQVNAFKALGVSVTDSNGKLRNQNDVFTQSITALGKVQNETQRNALAMTIFGKSATSLNPLIKAGGAELSEYAKQAQNSGAVMSEASIEGLAKFKDGTVALKDSLKGMSGTLAAMALPALTNFTGLVGKLSVSLNTALKTGNFSQFGTVLANGVTVAVSQLSGLATKLVPIAANILSSLVGALAKAVPTVLPALTSGVVLLVQSATQILQQNGPMLITAGLNAVLTLIQGISQSFPQITQAAIQTILTLINGISAQLPTLIPVAVNMIMTIVNGLLSNLPQIINSAIKIILALVQGIMNALPQLLEKVPEIIMTIITGLTDALPQLISMAPKIIVSIITGIIKALPQLILAAPKIILAVITGLIKALPQLLMMGPQMLKELWDGLSQQNWPEIGMNILKGIVNGFGQIGSWIWGKIQDAGNMIVNGFKSFFGIHSPSKLMDEEVGQFLGLGIAQGIQKIDFMGSVAGSIAASKSKISQAIQGLSSDMSIGVKAQMQPAYAGAYSVPTYSNNNDIISRKLDMVIAAIQNKDTRVIWDGKEIGNSVTPTVGQNLDSNVIETSVRRGR